MLPTPTGVEYNKELDNFLGVNIRIVFACFTSYIVAEPINASIVSKLKIIFNGKFIGFRFMFSTLISGILDSVFFIVIAFYGIINNIEIIKLIFNIWLVKSSIEFLGLPISIRLAKKLKKIEQIDIYDTYTKFNLFNLDINYQESDNKFNENNNRSEC